MIEPQYVRIRGRVHGPFDETKLRNMVQKGQLSRVHQVSLDQQSWQKAGELVELFASRKPASEFAQTAANPQHESHAGVEHVNGPPTEEKEWYYGSGDQPIGPLSQSQVQNLLHAGNLTEQDIVWKEGFPDWILLGSVPGFHSHAASPEKPQANGDHFSAAETPSHVSHLTIKSLMGSRGWILFFAITVLVFGSVVDIGAAIILLQGYKIGSGVLFIQGVSALIWGTILIVGAFFLFSITSNIYRLNFLKSDSLLVDIHDGYYRFWLYVGIVTIVFIAHTALLVFLAIGFGVEIGNYV